MTPVEYIIIIVLVIVIGYFTLVDPNKDLFAMFGQSKKLTKSRKSSEKKDRDESSDDSMSIDSELTKMILPNVTVNERKNEYSLDDQSRNATCDYSSYITYLDDLNKDKDAAKDYLDNQLDAYSKFCRFSARNIVDRVHTHETYVGAGIDDIYDGIVANEQGM
jgi:hypothetical protein